jgi:hypothetical protein
VSFRYFPQPLVQGKHVAFFMEEPPYILEDETGSLTVEVLGNCDQSAAGALPKDGDRVRVTGVVHVRETEPLHDVRILSTQIQTFESN